MADIFSYATSTGTVVSDTSDILDTVIDDLVEVFGISESAASDSSTSEGRLAEYITTIRKSVAINNAKMANQINPNLAEDGYFDAIYSLLGASRDGATRSSVDCTLTGVAGTVIAAGSYAQNSDTSTYWYSASDATLDDDGEATVTFFSSDTGEIAAEAGAIDQIITSITGWETITNESTATEGSDEQTTTEAKLIRAQTLATNATNTMASVISNVLALDNVVAVQGRENRLSTEQTIDGITIPAKSTWLCVDGGDIDDIAETYVTHSYGTAFYADSDDYVTGTYTDSVTSQEYSVDFDRPTEVPIMVQVTASLTSSTDLTSQIEDALTLWADGDISGYDGASMGNDISAFEIASALNSYFGASSVYISKVLISTTANDSLGYEEIDIALNEKATLSTTNMEIVSYG